MSDQVRSYLISQFFVQIVDGYRLLQVSDQLGVVLALVLLVVTVEHVELQLNFRVNIMINGS